MVDFDIHHVHLQLMNNTIIFIT